MMTGHHHTECLDITQWGRARVLRARGTLTPYPIGMLYGTVVEHVDMSVEEMQSILIRLIGDKPR